MNKVKIIEYDSNIDLKNKLIIGIDESGVGDYFGPLVAAAVSIPNPNFRQELIDLGVKDSKEISNKKIKELAFKIKKLTNYGISHLRPVGYNKLFKNYNSNYLKMFCHLNAIKNLKERYEKVDYIFIDQFSTLKSIEKYFNNLVIENNWAKFDVPDTTILLAQKAEDICLEVACASILARDYFLYFMENMNKTYNTEFPRGAGENVKIFAEEFFAKNPNFNKADICKMHFDMSKKDD